VRICVLGAGAIGGYLAVRLATVCPEVSVVARGAHLAAIRADGLTLIEPDGSRRVARLPASSALRDLGPQDVVILALKAHQLPGVAADVAAMLDPETVVISTQNGIPWWYFHKHGGPYDGRRIEAVDPGGVNSAALPAAQVIGCVVYPAAAIEAPGVVRVIEGNRFPLGELDGADTARIRRLAQLFRAAGLKTPVLSDIRSEIWLKLWGNLSFNPISALTHATLEDICRFPATHALAAEMMREAQAIGNRLGVSFKVGLEQRIAGAAAVGAHKTSMLQDLEQGRALELDALVASVIELGRLTGVPTPTIEHVHALAALLATTVGAARGRLRITSV
jgi:2-dehydropantoate 2-reductase